MAGPPSPPVREDNLVGRGTAETQLLNLLATEIAASGVLASAASLSVCSRNAKFAIVIICIALTLIFFAFLAWNYKVRRLRGSYIFLTVVGTVLIFLEIILVGITIIVDFAKHGKDCD